MKREYHDLREICGRGQSGNAVIDAASDQSIVPSLEGRVWRLKFEHKGEVYGALCILQTEDWKPKKGDLVEFVRQPEGVDDTFFFAFRKTQHAD